MYENCLKHRLEKAGYKVEAQKNLKVFDEDGFEIGDYFADLVVDKCLIIELKSVRALTGEHYAQTLNYLKTTGLRYALLINFGAFKFEVRRIVSTFEMSCREEASAGRGCVPSGDETRSDGRLRTKGEEEMLRRMKQQREKFDA